MRPDEWANDLTADDMSEIDIIKRRMGGQLPIQGDKNGRGAYGRDIHTLLVALKRIRTASDVASGDLALAARNLRRAANGLRNIGRESMAQEWLDAANETEQARQNLIKEAGL